MIVYCLLKHFVDVFLPFFAFLILIFFKNNTLSNFSCYLIKILFLYRLLLFFLISFRFNFASLILFCCVLNFFFILFLEFYVSRYCILLLQLRLFLYLFYFLIFFSTYFPLFFLFLRTTASTK